MRFSAVVVLALIMFTGFFGVLSDTASADPVPVEDSVLCITYRNVNGTQLLLRESSATAYDHLDFLVFYDGDITITVDGIISSFQLSHPSHFYYVFDEGSEHTIIISFGSHVYTYHFTVRKNISISDTISDVEELIYSASYVNSQKVMAAFFSFVGTVAGVAAAFLLVRHRSLNEVRSI